LRTDFTSEPVLPEVNPQVEKYFLTPFIIHLYVIDINKKEVDIMHKTLKIQILVIIISLLAMTLSGNNAKAQSGPNHLTGCVDRFGRIVKIAFGDSPSNSCIETEQQVTFKIEDPLGATETIPFYITLDGNGSEQTITINGPLEVFARCKTNDFGNDRIQVIATSAKAGWFITSNTTPNSANSEFIIFEVIRSAGSTIYSNDATTVSIASSDGSYLTIDGETIGLGLNVFGHSCIAVGTVTAIKGNPAGTQNNPGNPAGTQITASPRFVPIREGTQTNQGNPRDTQISDSSRLIPTRGGTN
jgi:hypothetical protein